LPKIEEESSSSDQDPKPEPELLLKSSEKGIIDHVVSILDKEPSLVNCRDSDGYTPLHRASYNGRMNVVRVLLQKGADVDARTEDGWQPLHCACRWGEYSALIIDVKLGRGSMGERIPWNSSHHRENKGENKTSGGANEALLNKNTKTTHLKKVSRQIIQTFQIFFKMQRHELQWVPRVETLNQMVLELKG